MNVTAFAAALGALALVTPLAAAAQEPPKSHKPVPYDSGVRRQVVPGLQRWVAAPGSLTLAAGARIVLPPRADAATREVAALLAADLRTVSRLSLAVVTEASRAGDIVLASGGEGTWTASAEGYALSIGDRVTLRARTRAGLFYASQSLVQLIKQKDDARTLARGEVQDWPDYKRRALMIDVGRKYFEIGQLDDIMRQMAWMKLNTLGLHFTDWPAFRLRSDKYPGLAARQSYSREDIAHLERTARRYGITIIPEIDLPAHASAIINYKPSLAFKCESMRQSPWLSRSAGEDAPKLAWTIDITREENRAWIRELLSEFIPWFSGPDFHIGGDEYQYDVDKNRCPELLEATKARGFEHPGDLFVDWINDTDKLVRAHGKRTVIWNWWRFKDDKTSIQPNKNILVYAWNSPRLADILANGYDVVVTPEDKLYVVPGIENFDGGGYGLVNTDHVYSEMPFERGKQVEGYMVALWADAAEHRTDTYLLARAHEPMAVVAERLWSGRGSASLDAFLARLNKASAAPRPDPLVR